MPDSPPPETLSWLRHAASCGQRDAQLTLHILERLEALEKKYETQRLATLEWGKDVDKLMRWIDDHLKRIMALEQPRQDKLDRLIALDSDDDAPAPPPAPPAAPAPAGELVERVAAAIAHEGCFAPDEVYGDEARAAIREVANWLKEGKSQNGRWQMAARDLLQEADRG